MPLIPVPAKSLNPGLGLRSTSVLSREDSALTGQGQRKRASIPVIGTLARITEVRRWGTGPIQGPASHAARDSAGSTSLSRPFSRT